MRSARTLVAWAKDHLPEPLVRSARGAVGAWGTATAGARMMPSFLVVGAQRTGTTTLYRLLNDHPDVVRPTESKGIGYFDLNAHRSLRWYRGHFPIASLAARGRDLPPVTFESSGYYCFHPLAAERIAAALPGIKLVMLVRDPVERAFSAYKHEAARGFEDETFARALDLEPERLDGEVDKLAADPRYESYHHRHHAYMGRGEYADQIVRLRAAVGDDAVHVMDADHFFADPAVEFTALTDWLGLRPAPPADVKQWNARPSKPLDEALRDRLRAHFEPHDERLATLTGRRPSWR